MPPFHPRWTASKQDWESKLLFISLNSSSYCNPNESDHVGGIEFSSSSVVGRTKWFVDSCLCANTLEDWIKVTRPMGLDSVAGVCSKQWQHVYSVGLASLFGLSEVELPACACKKRL